MSEQALRRQDDERAADQKACLELRDAGLRDSFDRARKSVEDFAKALDALKEASKNAE